MRLLATASLALVLSVAGAPAALAGGEQVTFELPTLDGETKRRADFASRYLLLVYQGMP